MCVSTSSQQKPDSQISLSSPPLSAALSTANHNTSKINNSNRNIISNAEDDLVVNVQVGTRSAPARALMDSGARVSVISSSFALTNGVIWNSNRVGIAGKGRRAELEQLQSFTGAKVQVYGTAEVPVLLDNKHRYVTMYVVKVDGVAFDVILGRPALRSFGRYLDLDTGSVVNAPVTDNHNDAVFVNSVHLAAVDDAVDSETIVDPTLVAAVPTTNLPSLPSESASDDDLTAWHARVAADVAAEIEAMRDSDAPSTSPATNPKLYRPPARAVPSDFIKFAWSDEHRAADAHFPDPTRASINKRLQLSPATSASTARRIRALLWKHRHVVREYPSGIVPMASIEPIKLEVLDGAYEVYRSQYPLSVAQKAERERIIGEGLKYGTWTKSTSHSLTPVLLVPKKNTDRMRLVQDNRQCNELCVSYAADMPNLGSLHAHLMNAKAVSKVDIASAFTSVPLHADSQPLFTSDGGPHGRVMSTRMSQGHVASAAIMTAVMHRVLENCSDLDLFVMIDDVILAHKSDDVGQQLQEVERILEAFRKWNLICNLDSSRFLAKKDVVVLGWQWSVGSITLPDGALDDIRNYPRPTTKAGLQRFIGMVQRIGVLYKDVGRVMTHLNSMLGHAAANGTIDWTQPHAADAFQCILDIIGEPSSLHVPRDDANFRVYTDASRSGWGCWLTAHYDGDDTEHVVAYASGGWEGALGRGRNPAVRECYSIREAMKKFWPWIGRSGRFKILTDSTVAAAMMTHKQSHSEDTIVRCAVDLAAMGVTQRDLVYLPGVRQHVSDALSRILDEPRVLRRSEVRDRIVAAKNKAARAAAKAGSAAAGVDADRGSISGLVSAVVGLVSSVSDSTADPVDDDDNARGLEGLDARPPPSSIDEELADARDVIDLENAQQLAPLDEDDAAAIGPVTAEQQQACPELRIALKRMRQRDAEGVAAGKRKYKDLDDYVLNSSTGLLMMRVAPVGRGDLAALVPVLPKGRRRAYIRAVHRSIGYTGIKPMMSAISQRVGWKMMRIQVEAAVKRSYARQISARQIEQPVQEQHDIEAPGRHCYADFATIGPSKGSRMHHVAVFVDAGSSYTVAAPTSDLTGKSVCDAFVNHYVNVVGQPETLTVDGGPAFVSRRFRGMCRELGIRIIYSSAYNPRGNRCESAVKRVKDRLTAIMAAEPSLTAWTSMIPRALASLNCTFSATVGTTPFEALYGRPPRALQSDQTIRVPHSGIPLDSPDYILWVRQLVTENHAARAERERQRLAGERTVSYIPGQFVTKLPPPRPSLLSTTWRRRIGPYLVVARRGSSYVLAHPDGTLLEGTTHGSKLQLFLYDDDAAELGQDITDAEDVDELTIQDVEDEQPVPIDRADAEEIAEDDGETEAEADDADPEGTSDPAVEVGPSESTDELVSVEVADANDAAESSTQSDVQPRRSKRKRQLAPTPSDISQQVRDWDGHLPVGRFGKRQYKRRNMDADSASASAPPSSATSEPHPESNDQPATEPISSTSQLTVENKKNAPVPHDSRKRKLHLEADETVSKDDDRAPGSKRRRRRKRRRGPTNQAPADVDVRTPEPESSDSTKVPVAQRNTWAISGNEQSSEREGSRTSVGTKVADKKMRAARV